MRRSERGVVPALLAWTLSTTALAQGISEPPTEPSASPGVLVLPPAIKGAAPEHIATALRQGVRDGLTNAGLEITEPPEGCTDGACAGPAVSSGSARAYVSTEVTITGSDYVLTADILDGEGKSLAHKEGGCEICTYEEAAVALSELVGAAAGELPPSEQDAVAVPPPVIEPGPSEPPRKRMQMSPKATTIIAWSAIGVGVAALAGGIALLVIDENPVESNCSGVHVDANGDCEFRYDTLGGGIGLTITGALVAGGGVGLLLYSRKHQDKSPPAELSLVPWGVRARF